MLQDEAFLAIRRNISLIDTFIFSFSNNDLRRCSYEGGSFYVRRVVDLMKTTKVNACIMYVCIYLERLGFYLYMQPKIISKCITLMTSKRQRHTYISDTGNVAEI